MTKQASSYSIPGSQSTLLEYQPASKISEQHLFLPPRALCVQLKHPHGPEWLRCNIQGREALIILSEMKSSLLFLQENTQAKKLFLK